MACADSPSDSSRRYRTCCKMTDDDIAMPRCVVVQLILLRFLLEFGDRFDDKVVEMFRTGEKGRPIELGARYFQSIQSRQLDNLLHLRTNWTPYGGPFDLVRWGFHECVMRERDRSFVQRLKIASICKRRSRSTSSVLKTFREMIVTAGIHSPNAGSASRISSRTVILSVSGSCSPELEGAAMMIKSPLPSLMAQRARWKNLVQHRNDNEHALSVSSSPSATTNSAISCKSSGGSLLPVAGICSTKISALKYSEEENPAEMTVRSKGAAPIRVGTHRLEGGEIKHKYFSSTSKRTGGLLRVFVYLIALSEIRLTRL